MDKVIEFIEKTQNLILQVRKESQDAIAQMREESQDAIAQMRKDSQDLLFQFREEAKEDIKRHEKILTRLESNETILAQIVQRQEQRISDPENRI